MKLKAIIAIILCKLLRLLSRLLHRGGTVCLIEVRITDEADKLLFLSTFNFYCVRR